MTAGQLLEKESGSWRAHRRSDQAKAVAEPQVIAINLEPVDIELVLVLLLELPDSVVLSFYNQLCRVRDEKTVTISEAGTPQLWRIFETLGALPDHPAMATSGAHATGSKPREVRLPDEKRGWSKKHIIEILSRIDADAQICEKIQEARLKKRKKKEDKGLEAVAAEVTSVDAAIEKKRYPKDQLAEWFEKLKQIAEKPLVTWTSDPVDGIEFLWNENLLTDFADAVAASGQMELVFTEDGQSFYVSWSESMEVSKSVLWMRVVTQFLSSLEESDPVQ